MSGKKFDTFFLLLTIMLAVGGFFLFVSAAGGLLARDNGASFQSVFLNQIFLGLSLGFISMFVMSRISYKTVRKYSFFLFILGVVLCILVFVPGIGFSHGGSSRWIDLRFATFQASEFLKIGFVLYFAAWLSAAKDHVRTFSYGTLPFLLFVGISTALLLAEPDTGTAGIVIAAGLGMFFVAGGKISHITMIVILGMAALVGLICMRPYLQERITVFMDPSHDPNGAGYQLKQSLITIGSGQIFGRGFGQGIQKFKFLPEPTNDSIFAVASEEFGFIGSSALVLMFLFFAMRGLHIASKAPDVYSRLVVVGLILLMIAQSFINIASMVGCFPLTGVPLIFVSHGGTALFFALTEVGMILNISRGEQQRILVKSVK